MNKELENTQKRLNIVSNVLVEVLIVLKETLPDHVNAQLANLLDAWDSLDDQYPMKQDGTQEDDIPDQVH